MAGGIYLHVPFCASFCIYCDFYSEIAKGGTERWRRALIQEIADRKEFFKDSGVLPETLYFGGGTPSLLPPSSIEEITCTIKKEFSVESFAECTIEVNPDDITPEKVQEYSRMGINRISMGVQSFCDEHLKWMNRRHTAAQAEEAAEIIRNCGINNLSIDLIFGFSGLSHEEWRYNIDKTLSLSPEHISCYQMSIEEGSALCEMARKRLYEEPSGEESARQYGYLQQRLSEAGYQQYEISNFSKPGMKSRHNSSYWEHSPYLGLGPAAHSYDGKGMRSWNCADLGRYCKTTERWSDKSDFELLSETDYFNEQIMLGLRKVEGFDTATLNQALFAKTKPVLIQLIKTGDIISEGSFIRIPAEKLFISDSIMEKLFLMQG